MACKTELKTRSKSIYKKDTRRLFNFNYSVLVNNIKYYDKTIYKV